MSDGKNGQARADEAPTFGAGSVIPGSKRTLAFASSLPPSAPPSASSSRLASRVSSPETLRPPASWQEAGSSLGSAPPPSTSPASGPPASGGPASGPPSARSAMFFGPPVKPRPLSVAPASHRQAALALDAIDGAWMDPSELESEPEDLEAAARASSSAARQRTTRQDVKPGRVAMAPPRRPSERATIPSLASAVSTDDSTLELAAVNADDVPDDVESDEPVFPLLPPPEVGALFPIPRPRSEPGLAELARSIGAQPPSSPGREPRPRSLFGAPQPPRRTSSALSDDPFAGTFSTSDPFAGERIAPRSATPASFVHTSPLGHTEPPRSSRNTPKLPPPRTPLVQPPTTQPVRAAASGRPRAPSGGDWRAYGQTVPPANEGGRRNLRRFVVPLVVSHLAVAAAALLVVAAKGRFDAPKPVRERRAAAGELTPLATPELPPAPVVPAGACIAGAPRVLAARAQVGPGLDVTVLDTGFGVGIASTANQAVGVRVEGSRLRVAETIRVKSPTLVHHVMVEPREDDVDGLDLHVDLDDARTVIGGGDLPTFRIVARGAHVMALVDDPNPLHREASSTAQPRLLWPLPAGSGAATPAKGRAALASSAASTTSEVVRAVGREDGAAIVALRRPGILWLGVTDADLAAAGPLVPLARKGATLGTPSVAPLGGGGVVAWAERPTTGGGEWTLYVASFQPDGEGATMLGSLQNLGHGMSPAIASLPDGELLLAYTNGKAGAHRVVARRLGRDLAPRGAEQALALSPEALNAGQPALAVRPDGRGIVAYFAADRGRSGASVLATPVECDPGL